MRRFSSYGPPDTDLHFHAPRTELIERVSSRLRGDEPAKGGHYITVWAPRQTGKTWVMREAAEKIKESGQFEVGIFSLESLKKETDENEILTTFVHKAEQAFGKKFPPLKKIKEIASLFTREYFDKPVILIIDEFDSLEEEFINSFAGIFRDIFHSRVYEKTKKSIEKSSLLHGLALVGVRSVLGIENVKGSPFNTQQGLHIPNLTFDEVEGMFHWYEKERNQTVEPGVILRLYYETGGQPGLTCWFGELLSEGFDGYPADHSRPVTVKQFETIYAAASQALPNNNILNIISKVKQEPYQSKVLEMFRTDEKQEFQFDDEVTNALYLNGVVVMDVVEHSRFYLKFSCPFIQKRLFNYFSSRLFSGGKLGTLVEPFLNLDDVITGSRINVPNLIGLYRRYLDKNREWLFKEAPRRSDLKPYEAVFHFNLYSYLNEFLRSKDGLVFPEFPTGNGKIDLLIKYKKNIYGIELKSYTDQAGYRAAMQQAAGYGKQLNLREIYLVFFVSAIDDDSREKYEKEFMDKNTGVTVIPLFVATGN